MFLWQVQVIKTLSAVVTTLKEHNSGTCVKAVSLVMILVIRNLPVLPSQTGSNKCYEITRLSYSSRQNKETALYNPVTPHKCASMVNVIASVPGM